MITAHDMAACPPTALGALSRAGTTPLAERILLGVLFVAMLMSSVAFVEPSPHDGLMVLVAVVALIAGLKFHRSTVPLIFMLLLWNMSGAIALANVAGDSKSIQYVVTTFYMSAAAVLFAGLLTTNSMERLASLRSGFLASAVIAGLAGISGHFHLFPGAERFEEYGGRAMGMFKDPNVYAPYLIWPALFVMSRLLSRGFRILDIGMLAILLGGIFLSFSRGAWGNLIVSAVIMLFLMVMTTRDARQRSRIIGISVAGLVGIGLLFALLMAVPSVREMFTMRAQAIQDYDVGQGGRFQLQALALDALLDHPLGMGPFEFGRIYGLQQHNVYLQAFVVYGWLGGVAYVFAVLATLVIGLRALVIATPWQLYLVTAYAAFVSNAGEGFIIDTDHWRHFFLLLGMVWGLSAATFAAANTHSAAAAVARR